MVLVTVASEHTQALARAAGDPELPAWHIRATGGSGSSTPPPGDWPERRGAAPVRSRPSAAGSLRDSAERVRRSIRHRLLPRTWPAPAVMTFLQLASGRLAPGLPLWGRVLGPVLPVLVLLVPAYLWGHRAFRRAIAWALEGRPPTLAERFAVLREPWRQALRPLLFWVLAALLYGGITALAGAGWITVVRVVEGTLIGGVTTCALAYLLIERSFHPLLAHVLDGVPDERPRTPGVRTRLLLTWAVGSGVPLLAMAFVLFLDGNEIPPLALAVLSLAGLAAGFLATVASALSIAEPLDDLRRALARVRDDDLDVGLVVDDGGEVGEVQAGFNRMVDGLRERREIQDLFRRHVGREVALQALERGTDLPAEVRDASAVFVDIIGSTSMAELLDPEEFVATLNDFFDVVVRTVERHGGWSASSRATALCVRGPHSQPDRAGRALAAAATSTTASTLAAAAGLAPASACRRAGRRQRRGREPPEYGGQPGGTRRPA